MIWLLFFWWMFGAVATTVISASFDARDGLSLKVEGWEWVAIPMMFICLWPGVLYCVWKYEKGMRDLDS